MAFNVSALTDYAKENVDEIISRSHFSSKTYDYLTSKGANTQTGIKTSEKILLIDEEVIFQSDSGCSFDPTGSSTYTQREIKVGAIKVNKNFCPKTLRAKATQYLLKAGSTAELSSDAAWVQPTVDSILSGIEENMEKAYWQGDVSSTDVNLNKFDGLLKNTITGSIEANTGSFMSASISGSGFTTFNINGAVNAMWRALPEKVKGKSDVVVAAGTDLFDLFIAAQVDANHYNYNPGDAAGTEYVYKIPGTGYTLVGFPGLSGTNTMRAFRASNVWFGADLENEEEDFDIWESKDDQNVKLSANWKAGVNVAYPSEVVKFTLQ